jgi:hypothetical protein
VQLPSMHPCGSHASASGEKRGSRHWIANQNGQTAFLVAAWRGHLECLKLMIEAKAGVNHQTRRLHWFIGRVNKGM